MVCYGSLNLRWAEKTVLVSAARYEQQSYGRCGLSGHAGSSQCIFRTLQDRGQC